MATRSNIAVRVKSEDKGKTVHFNVGLLPKGKSYDSSYKHKIGDVTLDKDYIQIYHHWDGYPDGVGQTLIDEFNDYDKALNLMLGGNASSINGEVVVQYCSWRDEPWNDVKPTLLDEPKLNEEYLYKFEDGKWWVKAYYDDDLKEWTDLEEYLKKLGEE